MKGPFADTDPDPGKKKSENRKVELSIQYISTDCLNQKL